jgi:hypothetical protein
LSAKERKGKNSPYIAEAPGETGIGASAYKVSAEPSSGRAQQPGRRVKGQQFRKIKHDLSITVDSPQPPGRLFSPVCLRPIADNSLKKLPHDRNPTDLRDRRSSGRLHPARMGLIGPSKLMAEALFC